MEGEDAELDAELGPEPDVIMQLAPTKRRVTTTIDLENFPVKPDWFKCGIAILLWIICIISFSVAFSAIKHGGLFCPKSPNQPTLVRTANMYAWANVSVSPCDEIYDFACGTYSASYGESSVFEETQRVVYTELDHATAILTRIRNMTADAFSQNYTLEELDAAGILSCLELEVAPDFADRQTPALYISASCDDCIPARTSGIPQPVQELPGVVPSVEAHLLVTAAVDMSRNVYFLPPNGSETTLNQFISKECNFSGLNSTEMWQAAVDKASASELYRDSLNAAMAARSGRGNATDPKYVSVATTNAFGQIVSRVRQEMVYQTKNANWAAGQRDTLADRVSRLDVVVGGGASVVPSCSLELGIYDCLQYRWQAQRVLLQQQSPLSATAVWDMAASTVNALYSPLSDTVQISAALLQPPLFSPDWPFVYQLASVGYIVAHELSHALSPIITEGWNHAETVSKTNATTSFGNCLESALLATGSNRSVRTMQELWADTIATTAMVRAFREGGAKEIQAGITGLVQNFCEAGQPRTRPFVLGEADAHPTAYLRTTAALYVAAAPQLASVWGCQSRGPAYACLDQ